MKSPHQRPERRQRLASRLLTISFWILTGLLALGNLRFYTPPTVTGDFDSVPLHAEAQLRWLRGELEAGSGDRMQHLFPEGWFFSHLLYGLSWVELSLRDSRFSDEALREARWTLARIESDQGKAPFSSSLDPDHGMFYSAWRNHLLSGILLIQPPGTRDRAELALFEERCAQLADTLENSPTPFPPSYPGQSWPCDAPPAIHSLKVRDALQGDSRYDRLIKEWSKAARQRVDSETGLLPHTASLRDGSPSSEARATSQTIILRLLADIDPKWAREQYLRFRTQYFTTLGGIPAIREYPQGTTKAGDVDSGPLIFGISGSATVVGMGVAQIYGDHSFASALSQAGEVIGFPFGQTERRYLGGILPVGDAFLVHATTARPWLEETHVAVEPMKLLPFWRWGVHALSLGIWIPGLLLLRYLRQRILDP